MVSVTFVAGQAPSAGTVYRYVPGGVVAGKKIPLMMAVDGSGPRHVPFRAGVPNRRLTMAKAASVPHTVMVLETPALGAVVTFTVTVAVRSVHGGIPATRYVYTPGCETPGTKLPLKGGFAGAGPTQAPPRSGVPSKAVKRFTWALVEHRLRVLLSPASDASFTKMDTVAVSLVHGAVPDTT